MNKKGAISDLFIFGTVIVCLIITCALILFLTTTIKDGLLSNADLFQKHMPTKNATDTINQLFGTAESAIKQTNTYIMFVFVALVLSFFVSNAFIRTNPYWFIFYAFVVGLAVTFSIGLKYAYFRLATNPILAPSFAEMNKAEWLVNYLPILMTVVGFIGGILLFIRMNLEDSL